MTLKELYETIKQKKESAEYDYYVKMDEKDYYGIDNSEEMHKIEGEMEAYIDLMCLIESSGELDDK